MPERSEITGVVLAGGRGARMGGVDKGLQPWAGDTLAGHALRRLQPQVGAAMVNANRHLEVYARLGVPVWPDEVGDYAGPLAGFVTALRHCTTPWLVTVPCDTPGFPLDLVARLAAALADGRHTVAVAEAPEGTPPVVRAQPVFCLLPVRLLPALEAFVAAGGRKIEAWTSQQANVRVRFDAPDAFHNLNTLAELAAQRP